MPTLILLAMPVALLAQSDLSVGSTELLHGLEKRERALDHAVVEYDWYQCNAPIGSDPYDRRNWVDSDRAFNLRYKAWILRPHYRLQFFGPLGTQRDGVDRAWVDGVAVSKQREDDGSWSIIRDADRWNTTGPIPVITALELWQVFDIGQGLKDLVAAGKLKPIPGSSPDSVIAARATRIEPPPFDWEINASFDGKRDLMPLALRAQLRIQSGLITWEMKTLDSVPLNGVHIIAEAIFSLSNSVNAPSEWQIYHYKVRSAAAAAGLSVEDVRPAIPSNNFTLLDEVGLVFRRVDSRGRTLEERKWTPEQRAREHRAIEAAEALRQASAGQVASRQSVFWLIVSTAACVVAVAAGFFEWRRRRLLR